MHKMKLIMIMVVIAIALLIAGCSSGASEQDIQTAIAETNAAIPTETNTSTPEIKPTNTLPPTSTPRPTSTTKPTNTPQPPTATPTIPSEDEMFAKNYVGTQDSGGLLIEVSRVLFTTKDLAVSGGNPFDEDETYDGIDVVGEVIFTVINTTDNVVTVYPDQATIVINDEQIELWEWTFTSTFGDELGGEIFPGVTQVGGSWFGINRSTVPEINRMIISINAPYDSNSYDNLGPDFYFDIDLSQHTWEDIPEDLANALQ